MGLDVALIGFGEAAEAFVGGWPRESLQIRAFDIKTLTTGTASAMQDRYAAAAVDGMCSSAEAVSGAQSILSVVTADQALIAAEAAAHAIDQGALFFDMNSVAPETKRAAADMIEGAGGRYVDVAVMAPVHPAGTAVPLLVSGDHAVDGAKMLRAIGFTSVRVVDGGVGRASAIKMIRSVVVKGIEAISAECVFAAEKAGVLAEVLASLDASEKPKSWESRADYNLDRMMVHGLRRAAEMEEVVKTLDALGTGSAMTRGTVARQRMIGRLGIGRPPAGLEQKIAAVSAAAEDGEALVA